MGVFIVIHLVNYYVDFSEEFATLTYSKLNNRKIQINILVCTQGKRKGIEGKRGSQSNAHLKIF